MCGITGIKVFSAANQSHLHLVANSVEQMKERGPDNRATKMFSSSALGHARLSIIDTSNLANQPFTSSCGQYTIVFNGEIFNFKELKHELQKKGYHFNTSSDTEVLLNLFIEFKEKCLNKLNGFFAFCIIHHPTEELFLARDRYGIKPLYFYADEDMFCFASELKALNIYPYQKKIDDYALNIYFQLGYIPSPYCILEGVKKLNQGHYLWVKNNKIFIEKYYEIDRALLSPTPSYNDAKNNIKTLLEDSVKKRLIADVPLGSFLSGGIDSSVIATIASKHTSNLNTFSIGYKDEPFFDETHYAELVAKKIKSNHTVYSLSNDDLFQHFERIVNYIDEPFADSSAIAVNILCYHVKQKVTVALSGDGADELFSGYNKHKAFLLSQKKSLRNSLIKNSSLVLNLLPKSRNSSMSNKFRQINRFSEGLKLNTKERYWFWAQLQGEESVNNLLLSNKNTNITFEKLIDCQSINEVLYNDFMMVLEGDMLKKVDSMSMANSLEVRVPFLDYRLVDYVFKLPDNYKIDSGSTKKILKDAYREELPNELFTRKKHGFEVPLKKWINNDLGETIDKLLSEEFVLHQGIFNYEYICHLRKKAKSNNPEDSISVIWMLIVFQNWYNEYFSR
jgi:asparagine synthase (glutamine-hydrolysing)